MFSRFFLSVINGKDIKSHTYNEKMSTREFDYAVRINERNKENFNEIIWKCVNVILKLQE